MSNAALAQQLSKIASLLELTGENAFKVRAYEKAADAVESANFLLEHALLTGQKLNLPGIGASIEGLLKEVVSTGNNPTLEQLQQVVPPGVLELSQLQGLGPKKLLIIWQELGILSMEALAEACARGELEKVKGLGPKTQANLLLAVQFYLQNRGRMRLDKAQQEAGLLLSYCQQSEDVLQAAITGQVGRAMPVVTSLQLVLASAAPQAVADYLAASPRLTGGKMQQVGWEATTLQGTPVQFFFTSQEYFANQLLATTAWGAHLSELQPYLNTPATSEAELYQRAGLPYIPPELRENTGELQLAAQHQLPTLLEPEELKGVLHAHSTYSDGRATLQAMALACKELGYTYLGITDHSRSAAYAGGLSIEKLVQQHAEIDRLNQELAPFRIFKGIESDILADGSLDYPQEVLASFDFIISSIHSGFAMDEATATRRLIAAAQNPYTRIMGHLTGRLLLTREGYPVNHKAVIDACAEAGTAIEINADPHRLDLDWQWVGYALSRGVPLAINPDAHSIAGIQSTRYGVLMGRKGGLTADSTLNAFNAEQFASWCKRRITK